MYGPVYNYDKSIKPAPNPYYLLNKFYGNLSIIEYRKLFKSEQLIYTVNKPLNITNNIKPKGIKEISMIFFSNVTINT